MDTKGFEAKLRASLEAAAWAEEERNQARILNPPAWPVRAAVWLLTEALTRLEHWTGDRCVERYRRMRR